MKLGQLEIRNTRDLASPDMRLCTLIVCRPKVGKTVLASGLDAVTQKYRQKPTLIIASERAEGGGSMSVKELGIDYVMPTSYSDMDTLISALATDATYGGILLDNGTDYINNIVKPHAQTFPAKDADARRIAGVPTRSDYQTMAELARKQLNRLINLTNSNTDPKFRKDLIVTSLERELSDDNGVVEKIAPDMPGALASAVPSMFQSVVAIRMQEQVVPRNDGKSGTRRIAQRVLVSEDPQGIRIVGDRTGLWQNGFILTDPNGVAVPLLALYEQWRNKISQS